MSITPRMSRLFGEDGKCFDVAIDHGFFNELSVINGIENMKQAVQTVIDASPDAIQLTPGQAHHLQLLRGQPLGQAGPGSENGCRQHLWPQTAEGPVQ